MQECVKTRPHQGGFTLLEVLVAISIFSIMSVVALTGIKTILDSQEITNRVGAQMKSLQNTFFYLDQDLRYAVARNIRDEFGDNQAAIQGGGTGSQGLALTRGGIGNPREVKRSSMIRVRYWLKDETLVRSRYKSLDGAAETQTLDRVLIDTLDSVEFRFLDDRNEWQASWPPLDPTADAKVLPRAVEIKLEHREIGIITRVIPLPGY